MQLKKNIVANGGIIKRLGSQKHSIGIAHDTHIYIEPTKKNTSYQEGKYHELMVLAHIDNQPVPFYDATKPRSIQDILLDTDLHKKG